MNDKFIDAVAALGKFGIENSSQSRDAKEWEKSMADCLSSALKLFQTYPNANMTVMGLGWDQVQKIKQIARQYSVEKVILFPYPSGQSILPLVRVYGGDRDIFFNSMGWNPIQSCTASESLECDNLEKEYGIVLYESV